MKLPLPAVQKLLDTMFLFLGMIIFILQFEGIVGKEEHQYHYGRDRGNALLPCQSRSLRYWYYKVEWLYNRDANSYCEQYVIDGEIDQRSAAESRLSVSRDGSLLIRNITAEDAGLYVCRIGNTNKHDSEMYLNILSISPSLPDEDNSVTLECSLNRHRNLISCQQNSIIWADESGNMLLGENAEFVFRGQNNCVSVLTVKHQNGKNKRFTCMFVKNNNVKIDAVYIPAFLDLPGDNAIIIIGTTLKGVLISLGVIVVLVFVYIKKVKATEDRLSETRRRTAVDDIQDTL